MKNFYLGVCITSLWTNDTKMLKTSSDNENMNFVEENSEKSSEKSLISNSIIGTIIVCSILILVILIIRKNNYFSCKSSEKNNIHQSYIDFLNIIKKNLDQSMVISEGSRKKYSFLKNFIIHYDNTKNIYKFFNYNKSILLIIDKNNYIEGLFFKNKYYQAKNQIQEHQTHINDEFITNNFTEKTFIEQNNDLNILNDYFALLNELNEEDKIFKTNKEKLKSIFINQGFQQEDVNKKLDDLYNKS